MSGSEEFTGPPPEPDFGFGVDRHTRQRRPVGLIVTVSFLLLALLATAGLAAYLWRTTDAWEAQSHRLETVAARTAGERDALARDLDQARRDLAATEEQLRRAQDRITALAEEKARTADEREYARQVATAAAGVASSLEECVFGQDQLITVLSDLERYEPDTVVQYAESVRAVCRKALEGNDELKRILEQ